MVNFPMRKVEFGSIRTALAAAAAAVGRVT